MSPNTRDTVQITTGEDFQKMMEHEHAEKQKDWDARRDLAKVEIELAAAKSRIAMQEISLSQWRKSDELGQEEFNSERADKERALAERDESRREAEDFRDNMRIHLTEGDGKFSWENVV